MFNKIGFSDYNGLKKLEESSVLADPRIMRRFEKLANQIKSIAPKSDDFLYFSIIFLKSAEACLINDNGVTKTADNGEKAWGYFDKDWKWHGNVQPHRNNNGDIFPELELKKATAAWIGMPLCKDHESSSVDGIRGIILDTYYDEKLKQVVGLCALDKINYPDLARKVETGMVRYGSMGTAVETSVCTECGNSAKTQEQYCDHIINRSAYGEVNVGLAPIEYSLVVQPAEPAARLLRCIASLDEYRAEFSGYGVQNVDNMLGSLSEAQAVRLSGIMKAACDSNGCSVGERRRIVTGFLNNLNEAPLVDKLVKDSGIDLGEAVAAGKLLLEPDLDPVVRAVIKKEIGRYETDEADEVGEYRVGDPTGAPKGETFVSPEFVGGGGFSPDSSNTGSGSWDSSQGAMVAGGSDDASGRDNIWDSDGAIQEGGLPLVGAGVRDNKTTIKLLLEDIMNESRLRKRAELRRRIAYHQGGADGVEPSTYKSETFDRNKDKQMQQTGNTGGDSGMWPGDKESKEKLSRAELEDRRLKREAYHQGGSDGVEPSTYKSETFDRNKDKQMHQTGNMGGDKGLFPGDGEAKQKLSRAAYAGPALRTKFSQKRSLNGSLNKAASVFSVYAGDKLVLAATAGEIFGPELEENWGWVTSRDYGKEVVKQIRESGVKAVAGLLKEAQDIAPAMEEPAADLGGEELPPLPELPQMEEGGLEEGGLEEGGLEELPEDEPEETSASERAETALMGLEDGIAELREIINELSGEGGSNTIKIDINGEDAETEVEGEGAEQLSLASNILNQLKVSHAEMNSAADEIAMIVETYQGKGNLTRNQVKDLGKITNAAVRDANVLCGESSAVCKMAKTISASMVKTSEYVEPAARNEGASAKVPAAAIGMVSTDAPADSSDELVTEAMELRKRRRESLVNSVEKRALNTRRQKRELLAKKAMENYYSEEDEAAENHADDQDQPEGAEDAENEASDHGVGESAEISSNASSIKDMISETVIKKTEDEARDSYKLKLRRAYDLGMEMQRKGLVPRSKVALDKQVDDIMLFDDRAFEAFKRSIGNARPIQDIKIAADLGGVNIGVETPNVEIKTNLEVLASMWE